LEFAIETNELTKRYGKLTAVDKLNLKVTKGSIHGFLGPNGAGKTTTIKILVGLLEPSEGTVSVLGKRLHRDDADTRLSIGYMPELPKFPKHLKGVELLDVYGRMYGITEQSRKEQIPKLIQMVGLKGRENDLIGKYSKGMQQRIGIAQALLNNPQLVILDEPSLGLDPVGMLEVRELVKNISKEDMTVFVSSHLLYEVEQICTHVTIINHGIMLASDTLQKVSSMLTGPMSIHVEVAKMSDAVVQALKKLPFIANVAQTGNELSVQVSSHDDVRVPVSETITKAGGVIVEMNLKGSNLEDVFMRLVSKDDGGKAQ
jgi:ABC-2 type transport system ATP-binding protein